MSKVDFFNGNESTYPLRVNQKLPGQSVITHGRPLMQFPDGYCDHFWDFSAAHETYTKEASFFAVNAVVNTNVINTTNTSTSTAVIPIDRAGVLTAAEIVGETLLSANDTNYITVTMVNKLGAGSGTTAMLAVTDANTTKSTLPGALWSAYVPRALTIHATAANLNVAAGDVIVVTVTTTQTLANVVNGPRVRLKFNTVASSLVPTVVRTAALAGIVPGGNVANGDLVLSIVAATNETQHVRLDFGDRLVIQGNKGPIFECRLKIATAAMNTTQNMVFGLASAFNATLESVQFHSWFKLSTTMDIQVGDDDDVTDRTDTDTGVDMVLGTYRTFAVDLSRPGYVRYFVNGSLVVERLLDLSTQLLQPLIALHKTGTTAVPVPTIDYLRVGWRRL